MKKLTCLSVLIAVLIALTSFIDITTLKGTWEYQGGTYNGKVEGPPTEYKMHRVYTDKDFIAYAFQKGYKTEKYEAGNYTIKGDTCFETQTFSSQPSQTTGKTITYIFTLQDNVLTLLATLPSGMVVAEKWIRVLPGKKK